VVSFLNDFGLHIPPQLTAATNAVLVNVPGMGWKAMTAAIAQEVATKGIVIDTLPHVTALINVPAVFIIALMSLLLVLGIKGSARFNNVMVAVKLVVIVMFIALGFAFVSAHNWTPFIPKNTGQFGHFGWSGIFRGAGVVFFAYIGFDAVSTAAQETKNPARGMPIGILGSLSICTILYILVAIVLTGLVSYTALNVPDPIAVGVNAMGPSMFWLRPIIKIAAIAGLSSVILVMLMGQPRIFFAMANDGLLPPVFAKVHPTFKTPYLGQILTGVLACILSGMLPISILGELVSIGTLFAFVIVCISVLVLRKTRPDLARPFKTPFMPVVPILGVAFCLSQMAALPLSTWTRLIVWMVIGFVIYFGYGIHRSKVKHSTSLSA
jgi:APA family basic amino acid/polyamine antiporter